MLSNYENVFDFIKNEKRNVKQPPMLTKFELAQFFSNFNFSKKKQFTIPTSVSFLYYIFFRHRFYWQA